ncbi:putative amastin-like surface protein [Leptomonas pyrrhocoris]|uniref:Putative amastin-like surface protein n=1 Tax=Leptomonas pyrrhocoris TaxID=157538 RepID=A0A0N0DSP5_LEPPY|nr:putative amastin-like surface protein [Leptomonas pyrrhocoris]XP_015654752.1 putative amastin-like surface protein [Leptomonas pyrrhocoris]XP_015654753.1 putative amastin-like surface protein [Leptomonas pyrrhocoris]KPA76312.1 putative amastin-like surface protein [Leptomonas pyrrhocoris]KPA76313.1 putative amastin-like surface protein [Leptomonas pyrrhocoris]KPA76314.1 putative amastin-like surface protein [Leptomonas pyrrhocoris]|eukprot:XP_015654751.1 putative amastin-like surface protein [Leptomonas pyrrhocoris]
MAKEGSKTKEVPACRMALCVVIAVVEFIGLFFMCIGSPYDQVKITSDSWVVPKDLCYSVWGTKRCSGSHPLAWHDAAFYARCGVFEATLKSAAAFSIISLFAFVMGMTVSLLLACKCLATKIPAVLILLFGVITSSVPFAAIAGLYNNSQCNARFRDIGEYQPGFAFFVISWCMAIISFILICFA